MLDGARLSRQRFAVQMKTMLEEVDVRLAETKRETHEFKRAVIVGAENPRTGCTQADKFVKCATPTRSCCA